MTGSADGDIRIWVSLIAWTLRFGLTGTLIQNSYDEMWSILDWTNPGRLGTRKQWKTYVTDPLKDGQTTKASDEKRGKALVCCPDSRALGFH